MKYFLSLLICFLIIAQSGISANETVSASGAAPDSLPTVLTPNRSDIVTVRFRNEAALKFASHQLPSDPKEWETYRIQLKSEILRKAGVRIDHKLPLNMKETGSNQMKGYTVKNITFQTRPGVYATANLYVPEGKGPYPGVINVLGHWTKGKIDPNGPQGVGHTLASNGYVCLTIDPWGAGERATKHGVFEYHGTNLGASLMNIGESLLGVQVSDNMRAADLLISLPYVDGDKLGVTGASGGGNQTMWFAALDERIKASVPVVSVGSFESYIMGSNCICELLIDGFTLSEEAAVLALANAVMPCNHQKDSNPTFFPSEMLRTYTNAREVFKMMGKEDHIAYRIFDLTHGYMQEDRQAMLGWFDYHLKGKGNGQPITEVPFEQLPEEKLMVFPTGQRDANVMSTDEYCRIKGNELRSKFLANKSFDIEKKRNELSEMLRVQKMPEIVKVNRYSPVRGWERVAIETSDNKLMPLLIMKPSDKSKGFVIICNPDGKKGIPLESIEELRKKGTGIAILDLTGTGEAISKVDQTKDKAMVHHTLSRAELWLGRTMLGEWVNEINIAVSFLKSDFAAEKVIIDGTREAGLAGLYSGALKGDVQEIILRNSPVSYLFDNRENVSYFSMAIHLPGFLNWGDVSLAAALSGKNVSFINPVTMSGQPVSAEKLKAYTTEFGKIRSASSQPGSTVLK